MYSCVECGYKSVKWLGKCPTCSGWETFRQEQETGQEHAETLVSWPRTAPVSIKNIGQKNYRRITTDIMEFDRVLGGGLVFGEIILIGGEPGIGKSTFLLEVGSKLANKGKVLYVSAEESCEQVGLRAKRLNVDADKLFLLSEDNLQEVYEYIKQEKFEYVIIDSIQVVFCPSFDGSKGSVQQIKGCADYLTQIAKRLGVVVFVVGHVTKDGALAGPKLLEHIVDCVMYFESEQVSPYRILRASKNRFGPTGDIAVFEMTSLGLKEVSKLNDVFLPHQRQNISGSSVVCILEGFRPIFVEMQALVSKSGFGIARRRSLGFDFNRFSLLIAIIEKRLKCFLSGEDIFLNVAGGITINDPAADLGVITAIFSSLKEKALPLDVLFIGEVGLGGELRRVNNINQRLKEAGRANFKRCFIPLSNAQELDNGLTIKAESASSLTEVIEAAFK